MELRRTLEEVHALYQMEPELRDLYVEGYSDKFFFEWYLAKGGIRNVTVYPIELLDIPDSVLIKHSLPTRSNKARLIALSYECASSGAFSRVMCIADRDFDNSCSRVQRNSCLEFTDGTSLELYALQPLVFQKFVLVALGGLSISGHELLSECISILERVYTIRVANEDLKWGMSWIPFRSYTSIKGSSLTFRETDFIRAYLQKNGRWGDRDIFINKVDEVLRSFDHDPMRRIRGHDLSELLFVVLRKLRREKRFGSPETLESCLLATVEAHDLQAFSLFRKLSAFAHGNETVSEGEQSPSPYR